MKKWIVQFTHDTMPARMQPQAENTMREVVKNALEKHELTFEPQDIAVHATPCRLVVMANVADVIARKGQIFLGPRVDAPSQAVDGFMRQHGIADQNQLRQDTNKKGALCYVFYKEQPQRNAIDCLSRVLEDILLNMKWQKSMHWGKGNFLWVRPLRTIESVYGTKKLQGGFFLGDDTTPPQYMETPHAKTELFLEFNELADGDDYENSLKKAGIILARGKRAKSITQQVQAIADKYHLTFKHANFEMMAGLSENPIMLSCPFPQLAQTLTNKVIRAVHPTHALPNEVIQAVCDAQYNIIPLQDKNNTITHVAFVTDNAPQKAHTTIIEGYKTLLKARLADADFYMKQDQKETLEHHAKQLEHMTFHAGLGSMMDKTNRMVYVIHNIPPPPNAQGGKQMPLERAQNLAQLAKADLATQMVAEFPSLQGHISAYYAKKEGYDTLLVKAIGEHYHPSSMDDDLPASELGCLLALVDKLDTVVGFFLELQYPRGSKDPYGLRRAAIGIARILIERLPNYPLMELINTCAESSPAFKNKHKEHKNSAHNACCFVNEQMRRWLVNHHNYDSRLVNAILDHTTNLYYKKARDKFREKLPPFMPVTEKLAKIRYLHEFHADEHKDDFINVYKRVCHFAKDAPQTPYKISLCEEPTEATLYNHWQQVDKTSFFIDRLNALATLREPLEAFCSAVKVFDDDDKQRENRIILMEEIKLGFDATCEMEWLVNPNRSSKLWSW